MINSRQYKRILLVIIYYQTLQHCDSELRHNYIYKLFFKLATVVGGDPKAPFSIATTPKCSATLFPELLHITLDTYLILLLMLMSR